MRSVGIRVYLQTVSMSACISKVKSEMRWDRKGVSGRRRDDEDIASGPVDRDR